MWIGTNPKPVQHVLIANVLRLELSQAFLALAPANRGKTTSTNRGKFIILYRAMRELGLLIQHRTVLRGTGSASPETGITARVIQYVLYFLYFTLRSGSNEVTVLLPC